MVLMLSGLASLSSNEGGVSRDSYCSQSRASTFCSHGAPPTVDYDEGESEISCSDDGNEADTGPSETQPLGETADNSEDTYPCAWISAKGNACSFMIHLPIYVDDAGWKRTVMEHLKEAHADDVEVEGGIVCRWGVGGHGKRKGKAMLKTLNSLTRHILYPHLEMTRICIHCGETFGRKDPHMRRCNG